jgi:hypothetical protein
MVGFASLKSAFVGHILMTDDMVVAGRCWGLHISHSRQC